HGATFGTIAMNGDLDAPALYGPYATFSEKIPAPLTCRAESPAAAARASIAALEETIARRGGRRGVGGDDRARGRRARAGFGRRAGGRRLERCQRARPAVLREGAPRLRP